MASFCNMFQKEPVASSLYSKAAQHCRNVFERNSIIEFFLRDFQSFAIKYFP